MIGDAAHRGAFVLAAVPARQSKLEFGGRHFRIVEKHLVEIPETVHQDIFPILVLNLEILLHHRRHEKFLTSSKLLHFYSFILSEPADVAASFFVSPATAASVKSPESRMTARSAGANGKPPIGEKKKPSPNR